MNLWISSNRATDLWHLADRREMRGDRTGKIICTYYVTACTGHQLGGPWGQSMEKGAVPPGMVCPRCEKLSRKVRP